MDGFRKDVKAAMDESSVSGLQATEFKALTEAQVIAKVGALFTADQKKNGILASVSLAQFILESGYGKSELAQNANNCFGMKKSLSGNTWSGSSWDGTSVYTKQTKEQNADGSYETITADFRKYACVEDSIADHSAYLLGAKNGRALRYKGIKGMTDYKAVAQLVKDGGYATSLIYVENLCGIIEKWNLTQYDVAEEKAESPDTVTEFPAVPFTVKVLIDDLNYRSEPSMDGTVKGQTGKGVFTIVEVSDGWGRLKSGAGWIWLENPSYCTVQGTVAEEKSETSSLKSVDEIAKEVIRGDWGNGDERKKKLTAAGYDYAAVQKRVNEMLS
jgi:flagellum-specific peptidoglycan hydrolase FlgJ